MARIAGVNIPKEKRFLISLTYIYGIGLTTAQDICKKAKIDLSLRTHQLNEAQLAIVREIIAKKGLILEGDLKRKVGSDIKRLIEIGCYRGIRHVKKLPVRGQRTHTNAKTRKGRGVAIANKKKAVK